MTRAVKQMLDDTLPADWDDWRWQWQNRITEAAELRRLFPKTLPDDLDAETDVPFRFAVTPYYLSLADRGAPNCPILAQVVPRRAEQTDSLFEDPDPLREEAHMPVPGLTHRYPDRVLWYLSHNCAVYCRFCMRKRKVSRGESAQSSEARERTFAYIAQRPAIKEVILSGGDPLSMSDDGIARILQRLRAISHLRSVRIHTRMPVTLPQRFTPDLLRAFSEAYPLTLVTHFNHERELAPPALAAVRALRMHGVLVLNQAVLLRGVNDSLESQERLHLGLVAAGVKPYYLHQCDEVRGVSHFRVTLDEGLEIVRGMRGRNPGISLPTYVVDLPGGGGKVPVEGHYLTDELRDGRRVATNWRGAEFSIQADSDTTPWDATPSDATPQ